MISIESMAITKDATQGGMSARSALAMLSTALRSLHLRKAQMSKRIEVKPGDRYGRWSVLQELPDRRSPTNGRAQRMVECRCECGTIRALMLESLRQATAPSRSCGCIQRESAIKGGHKNRTHGQSKSITYSSWAEMKQRCYNKNDVSYGAYGNRDIQICERWRDSFEAFLADMGERPSKLHSIDRYPDNNGNYEPGNCRWATQKQQNRNRRSNVVLTFRGETMCISEWAERVGLPRKALEKRLNHHGFTVEQALTLPLRARRASQ
jgi:hypothetical protein